MSTNPLKKPKLTSLSGIKTPLRYFSYHTVGCFSSPTLYVGSVNISVGKDKSTQLTS